MRSWMVALTLMVVGHAAAVPAQSAEGDRYLLDEDGIPIFLGDDLIDVTEFTLLDGNASADGTQGILTEGCFNTWEPVADRADEVFIYGNICHKTAGGTIVDDGAGVCAFNYPGTGSCYVTESGPDAKAHGIFTSSPYCIEGDGGPNYPTARDFMFYVGDCGFADNDVSCDGGYWVSTDCGATGGWPSSAQMKLCGDYCPTPSYGVRDDLYGWLNRDYFYGGGGDDVMYGEYPGAATGGDDIMYGENGNDVVYGGYALETSPENVYEWLFGGEGADVICPDTSCSCWTGSGTGVRVVSGDAGNDIRLYGGLGPDYIYGGTGADGDIRGHEGNDYLQGGLDAGDFCDGNDPTTSPGDTCVNADTYRCETWDHCESFAGP